MKSLFFVFIGSLCLSLEAARSLSELQVDEGAAAGQRNFSIHVVSASLLTPAKAVLKLWMINTVRKLELPIILLKNTTYTRATERQVTKSLTPVWNNTYSFTSPLFTASTQVAIELWDDQSPEDKSVHLESFIGGVLLSVAQLGLKPNSTTLPITNKNHNVGSVLVHHYDIHQNA